MKLEQIATVLRTTPQTLQQTLAPYDNDVAQWRPTRDAWCINEVLGHLIEAQIRLKIGDSTSLWCLF